MVGPAKSKTVEDVLRERAEEVRRALDEALQPPAGSEAGPAAGLYEAMRYMALGGGKKLRPALVLLAPEARLNTRQSLWHREFRGP